MRAISRTRRDWREMARHLPCQAGVTSQSRDKGKNSVLTALTEER